MSYQVLARKWRPRSFPEVVGQEHVLRALMNALDQQRLHHAYLFTGTRGVGKTTLGRILARCLNCEDGITSKPCGSCRSCTEISEGRFVDLIEVDAASQTKVEQTRELLENAQYAPSRGRFKVYLIDEVHMLSKNSFNALLKTLEEPPEHVKFILATTDPQKLPVTVLSRCLQFNLKNLTPELIGGQLHKVLEAEGIQFDEGALRRLARAADGSMRDALSLTDQAVAFGDGRVMEADVCTMLGSIERDHAQHILEALLARDGSGVLKVVGDLAMRTPDFLALLEELLALLHRLAVLQAVPGYRDDRFDDEAVERDLAKKIAPENLQLFYQIGLHGRRDMAFAPDPRAGLEMALLRMISFLPVTGVRGARRVESVETDQPAATPASEPIPDVATGQQQPEIKKKTVSSTLSDTESSPVQTRDHPVNLTNEDWIRLSGELNLRGVPAQLAAQSTLIDAAPGSLRIMLNPQMKAVLSAAHRDTIQAALSERLGDAVQLNIEVGNSKEENPSQRRSRMQEERHRAAMDSLQHDPTVRELEEQLGGRIVEASVKPLD